MNKIVLVGYGCDPWPEHRGICREPNLFDQGTHIAIIGIPCTTPMTAARGASRKARSCRDES
jgi:hypothetical protein